jgi:hypothetical protein
MSGKAKFYLKPEFHSHLKTNQDFIPTQLLEYLNEPGKIAYESFQRKIEKKPRPHIDGNFHVIQLHPLDTNGNFFITGILKPSIRESQESQKRKHCKIDIIFIKENYIVTSDMHVYKLVYDK